MKRVVVLVAVLTSAAMARAQEKASAGDVGALQGQWKAILVKDKGADAPPEIVQSLRVTVKGNEITTVFAGNEGEIVAKYRLDAKKSPKSIDLLRLEGGQVVETYRGIYKLDGNRWTLCVNLTNDGERPTEFASPLATTTVLLALQRAKE